MKSLSRTIYHIENLLSVTIPEEIKNMLEYNGRFFFSKVKI